MNQRFLFVSFLSERVLHNFLIVKRFNGCRNIPKNKLIFIFGKSHFPSSQQGFSYNPTHPIELLPDSVLVEILDEVHFE
ncbi:hypothetical protein AJ90_14395 [Vibrio parahaemolyticus M0605]|nr:hypothetical protein AJ90_14395 [Vibrio parahaemolyticus M0605]